MVGVERALVLLKDIALAPDGAGVRDLARSRGYSPSVVAKSLQALLSQGFVEQDPTTRRYRVGPVTLQVGLASLARLDLRRAARPHLESLAAESGETALLGVRSGDVAIYIDKVLVPTEIRVDAPLGAPRPFNCTAVGKVLLAHLAEGEFSRLAASGAFVAATAHSVIDSTALRLELANIRERGVAMDHEEFIAGVTCVAAPVRNHDAEVVAAVTAAGPIQRVSVVQARIAQQVFACAKSISAALGYAE